MRLPHLFAIALAFAPAAALAHPHIYIDGGVNFRFDERGRLAELLVTWIYDPLTSLFMLEELGIDAVADADLTPETRAALAAYQTEWGDEFEGDSYLWDGASRIGLSGPESPDAVLMDGKVAIRFSRTVSPSFRPGPDTVVKIYDPTYFTAYAVTETPKLEGNAVGCAARVIPFEPRGPLMALQRRLSSVPIDAEPEDANVGALFADRVALTCD